MGLRRRLRGRRCCRRVWESAGILFGSIGLVRVAPMGPAMVLSAGRQAWFQGVGGTLRRCWPLRRPWWWTRVRAVRWGAGWGCSPAGRWPRCAAAVAHRRMGCWWGRLVGWGGSRGMTLMGPMPGSRCSEAQVSAWAPIGRWASWTWCSREGRSPPTSRRASIAPTPATRRVWRSWGARRCRRARSSARPRRAPSPPRDQPASLERPTAWRRPPQPSAPRWWRCMTQRAAPTGGPERAGTPTRRSATGTASPPTPTAR